MTSPLDHETCSRLLRAYAAGEAGADAAAVTDHLQGCQQCSTELEGVKKLLEPVEPLTEAERFQLHAFVSKATRPHLSRAPAKVAPEPRSLADIRDGSASSRARMRWSMPAMSAAAAVILIAGGIAFLGHMTTGQNSAASADRALTGAVNAPESTPGASKALAQPGPRFDPASFRGIGEVRRAARPVLADLSHAYELSDARALATGFLDRLVNQAPPGLRRQILHCGGRVLGGARPRVLLPAFGAQTSANGQRALVLVFFSARTNQRNLSRFEVDTWPRGSCDAEHDHSSGIIRPR